MGFSWKMLTFHKKSLIEEIQHLNRTTVWLFCPCLLYVSPVVTWLFHTWCQMSTVSMLQWLLTHLKQESSQQEETRFLSIAWLVGEKKLSLFSWNCSEVAFKYWRFNFLPIKMIAFFQREREREEDILSKVKRKHAYWLIESKVLSVPIH